jgi:hypothetical protein
MRDDDGVVECKESVLVGIEVLCKSEAVTSGEVLLVEN